jgi:hypothetical protein
MHATKNGAVSFSAGSFLPRDALPAWEQSFFVEEKGWVASEDVKDPRKSL